MATASTPASPVVAAQARLILQDPNAASEAKLPALRLSRELLPSPTPAMDRATAQQVWQALQLTPDELITQRLQLLDAYTKQDSATANARAARAEAAKHKIKLKELQDTRWQHPFVYGAGAAFLGLAGLWMWERKKRLAVQRSALPPMLADAAIPSAASTALVPSLPPAPLAVHEAMPVDRTSDRTQDLAQYGAPISDPIATSITQEDLQSFVVPLEPAPTLFQRPAPWWKRWGRNSVAPPALAAPGFASRVPDRPASWATPAPAVLPAPQVQPPIPPRMPPHAAALPTPKTNTASAFITTSGGEASIAFDDSHDDDLGMEAPGEEFYASDVGTLQSYNPMRSKLSDVEDAMEQLLEIRMAVQAMVDLGQLPAAKKLLDNHIDGLPHTSAWAYLVHLDLCSQMGQRDAFEDMRKRYRLQFNRLAPYWKEVDAAVQTLDTYNRPVAELCALWHSPKKARSLIATWLLGAQYSRRQFQLPAYYDLLDLYDMLEAMDDAQPSVYPADPTASSLLDLDFSTSSHAHLDLPTQRVAGAH